MRRKPPAKAAKKGSIEMTPRATPSPKSAAQPQTVTCRHCRYERPASDARCHICGYPWPWVKPEDETPRKKPKP